MTFPTYPHYKDSGVEWIKTIPATWNVSRIKNTTYLKGRVGWKGLTSDEFLDHGYSYLVTGTDFKNKYIDWTSCYSVDKERFEDDPFIQLQNDDLLITKDGTIGKLAIVKELNGYACLNSGIFLVRPLNTYLAEYMYWVLSSNSFRVFCDLSSQGSTIQHLYQNVFEKFLFPSPPKNEQKKIINFLDRETAKIDALIQEQEKLIELLKEKRQAVIRNAVCRGLDPNVPMKDSGVGALGMIPEHWNVDRLKKNILQISSGVSVNAIDIPAQKNEIAILKTSCVYSGEFNPLENKTVLAEEIERVTCSVTKDTLIVSRMNTPELVGAAGLVRDQYQNIYLPDRLWKISFTKLSPAYVHYWTQTKFYRFLVEISCAGTSSSMQNLTQDDFGNFIIAFPPFEEQQSVVEYLNHEIKKFAELITESIAVIKILNERRSAVISAAVTGQIDVRNFGH